MPKQILVEDKNMVIEFDDSVSENEIGNIIRQNVYGENLEDAPLVTREQVIAGARSLWRGIQQPILSSPTAAASLVLEQAERFEEEPDKVDFIQAIAGNPHPFIMKKVKSFIGKNTNIDEGFADAAKVWIEENQAYLRRRKIEPEEGRLNEFLFNLGSGVTTLGAAVGMSVLTKSSHAAAALFGAYQKSNIYREARMAGLEAKEAGKLSTAAGVVEGSLEYIGLDFMLKRYGSRLFGLAIRSGTEAFQEFSQQTGENILVKFGGVDKARQVFEGAGEAALIGAILGVPASVGIDLMNDVQVKRALKKGDLTEKQATVVMERINEAVREEVGNITAHEVSETTQREIEEVEEPTPPEETEIPLKQPITEEIMPEVISEVKPITAKMLPKITEEPVAIMQKKILSAIKEQAKTYPSKKAFIDAIAKGEITLPIKQFEQYGITEFEIDRELAKGLYEEVAKEEATKMGELKRQIYANAAVRGISKAQLDRITKKETGRGSIHNKTITEDKLTKVLKSLKKIRPERIGGREVITKKTEKLIEIAHTNMIKKNELTEKMYKKILEDMDIQTPKYIGAFQFITESKGKELLSNMRYLSAINKKIVQIENAYKINPVIKEYVDDINEANPAQPVPKLNTLMDAHHAYDFLELQTKAPCGRAFEQTREHWHEAVKAINKILDNVFIKGGKNWNKIIKDEASLERMQQYLGYKRPEYIRGKPEYPKGITSEEKAIVDEMIKYGESVKNDIRYDRVMLWIKEGARIPNAPLKELNKAENIYFTEGPKALKKWLENKSWGVVTGGAYDFGEIMKGKIRLYKPKPGVTKKGLVSKESLQYTKYDTNLVSRFRSYVRGITLRKHLRDDINAIKTLIETHQNLFEDPKKTLDAINRNLSEVLGQKMPTQILEDFLRSIYSQAARTLFLDARKGIRNLFQNMALFTSPEDALKAIPMSKEDMDYFNTFVKQESSIKYDYLYADINMLAKIPILKDLNDLADLINVMGRTDTINRYVAFRMKLGATKDALKKNPDWSKSKKNLDKLMKDAGMGDLTPMERIHALDKLMLEGEESFARYVAKQVVEKVHFLYTRFERGMSEQGNELSKVLSNLLTFRKGYLQRLILDISKLRPSQEPVEVPIAGRRRATRSLFMAIVMATITGAVYQILTGDKRNPYRPDNILGGLSLGGLAIGSQEKLNEFSRIVLMAASGDKKALGRLPAEITTANRMFIPFYNDIINIIEATTNTRDLDKRWIRQIREMFDKKYDLKESWYKQQRSLIEKLQHAIFGTDKERKGKVPKIGG